jgi:SAM-dependent methyltransferase
MTLDTRSEAAKFYDLNPDFPPDVSFYLDLIPSPDAAVLELGCGTGRVTIPLARHCGFVYGLDLSPAMIRRCGTKLDQANIPPGQVVVSEGDITDFDLGRQFDFILAPFRVLQNLETDEEVEGLLRCIRQHLAPGGTCVLNVFKPFCSPHELRERWLTPGEQLDWEVPQTGGKVACYSRRSRLSEQRLVLYPDLIYRRYAGATLVEEIVLHLVMRCYYPETFEKLITSQGFRILKRWGGYAGEAYGEGPELVLQFEF